MAGIYTKHNTTGFSDALICEAEGLEQLASVLEIAGVENVRIPEVLGVDHETLKMTAIQAARADDRTLELLGEGLASLHRIVQTSYGWRRDNYIGLAPQPNQWTANWGDFFVRDRLGYQVSRITDATIRQEFEQLLDQHGPVVIEWLNRHCEHPSLLHGDLWRGNALFDGRDAWLIDPAIYCGDREADLAMTEMFGGFGAAFYRGYDRIYPRSASYDRKREIYNLYHYLNHYNLFGGGYLSGCKRGFLALSRMAAESDQSAGEAR
ncbi:fructosamine kinase family protein [Marinobacter sp. F4206]|uniref:fructosamine kinase family protein n=1 Tax=Marinobacter sp. F4206 TaxID=2861777 RepID=UPI001C5E4B10|nr:fructosamine kinase family protein [Marinobacter sp. F4206]MBW4933022.1 fructosamine kinase family protein [Marinobacter sp. F4206]